MIISPDINNIFEEVDSALGIMWVRYQNLYISCLLDIPDLLALKALGKSWSINYGRRKNLAGYPPYIKSWKLGQLHRFLLKVPEGSFVDHIDRDTLNNRRNNLRVCSNQTNSLNRGKQRNNTSGYRGVCWSSYHGKWKAFIQDRINGNRHLGYCDNKEEAAALVKRELERLQVPNV